MLRNHLGIAGGNLCRFHGGNQGVEPIQGAAFHRNADDSQGGVGGAHAGQVGRTARGDEDLEGCPPWRRKRSA